MESIAPISAPADTFALGDIKGIYVRPAADAGYFVTNIRTKIPATKLLEWRRRGPLRAEFCAKKEAELGVSVMIKGDKTTLIHQCVLEDVLRYCGVYESIIDAIVPFEHRAIKQIVCGELRMNICLANDHFDLTALLISTNRKFPAMRKIKSLIRFAELLYEYENKKEFAAEPGKDVWDHYMIGGIDYDAHKWLPQIFLPHIAQWCSEQYAVLVSQIMMAYHRDPIYLARIGVVEFDRQTGLHTTAVFKSTADAAEHAADVARLEALVQEWRDKHAALADSTARQMIIHRNAEYGAMALQSELEPFRKYISGGGTIAELESKAVAATKRSRTASAAATVAAVRVTEAEAAATAAAARIAELEAAVLRAAEDYADIERQFTAIIDAAPGKKHAPGPPAALLREFARLRNYSVFGDSPRAPPGTKQSRPIVRQIASASAAAAAAAPPQPDFFTIRAKRPNELYIYTDQTRFAAIHGPAINAHKMCMIYKGYIELSEPGAPLVREFAATAPGRTVSNEQLFIATPDAADAEAALCAFLAAKITRKFNLYGDQTSVREILVTF